MVSICANDLCSPLMGTAQSSVEAYLIFPREEPFIVLDEAIFIMLDGVGRIYKQEIFLIRPVDDRFKVGMLDHCPLKNF